MTHPPRKRNSLVCWYEVREQQLILNSGNDSERTVWQNESFASEKREEIHKTFCEQNRLQD
jgi:hypothetical protein